VGRTLVTGAGGLLGSTLVAALSGEDVHAFAHAELDVADRDAVERVLGSLRPDLVVHCAAWTNVDGCESDPARAVAVNADGPGYVAAAAASIGAQIVAVSTDYVFDGEKGSYVETDATNPLQVYGRAKLDGEQRVRDASAQHYIVRSAWIYGPKGHNFISQVPALASRGGVVQAVDDQRSSPTYAPDLAAAILRLAGSGRHGTYHVTNAGSCSYAEFFRHGFEVLGAPGSVEGIPGAEVPRPAARPRDSSLVDEAWDAAGFEPLRPWRDAARAFLSAVASA
jgi:dTDP-4-dehydrorhamnose reductase